VINDGLVPVSDLVTVTSKAIITVPRMTFLNNRDNIKCVLKIKPHVSVIKYIPLYYVPKNISDAPVHSKCQNKFRQATLCHYLNSG